MIRRTAALALVFLLASLALHATAAQRLLLHADTDGVRTTLDLRIDAGRVDGTATESGVRLAVAGTLDGQRLKARLQEPLTGLTLVGLSGTLHADRLEATVTPMAGGQPTPVVFMREGAVEPRRPSATTPATPAPAAGAGSLDPRLVGRWFHQSIINSPGGVGFASFTTERTMEFSGDGRIQQSSRSVSGGGNWSGRSDREVQFVGRWQVRGSEIWMQADGGGAFERIAQYRFSGNALVLEGGGGRRIWQR